MVWKQFLLIVAAGLLCADGQTLPPSNECGTGDIRIVNSATSGENRGHLEICINDVWGSVCGDTWGVVESQVACAQLGYSATGAERLTSNFSRGFGKILLENVNCLGGELRVIDCSLTIVREESMCPQEQVVGIACRNATQEPCDAGGIRLQGGMTGIEGRVEVCLGDVWGTVCNNSWSVEDAQVACRQLRLSPHGAEILNSGFEKGEGMIWLNEVECAGHEGRLIDCFASEPGKHDCGHSQDVGIRCGTTCMRGDIRIASVRQFIGESGASTSGPIEICDNNNQWRPLCFNSGSWTTSNAQVTCRQLGFSPSDARTSSHRSSNETWLDALQCSGSESTLLECPGASLDLAGFCSSERVAGVECLKLGTTCPESAVRLQNITQGPTYVVGRLEVCHNNIWGTVCANELDSNVAETACTELGYVRGSNLSRIMTDGFSVGIGEIWYSSVRCFSHTSRFAFCDRRFLRNSDGRCTHANDAGVLCRLPECQTGAVRLVGGNSTYGQVEVCVLGVWGTVCNDSWNDKDAEVVCRQLGFSPEDALALSSVGGSGRVLLNAVQCTGSERRLLDCPTAQRSGVSACNTSTIATLSCSVGTCTHGDVRLVGVAKSREGLVEVCIDGRWGSICQRNSPFSVTQDMARVICSQLGFPDSRDSTRISSGGSVAHPPSIGPTWLENVRCSGSESHLIDCPATLNSRGVRSSNCEYFHDFAVRCVPTRTVCTGNDVRLQGGVTATQGRVEICRENIWTSVCGQDWDTDYAELICSELGHRRDNAQVLTTGFTYQDAPVWVTEIDCRRTTDYFYSSYDYFYAFLESCDITSITQEQCGQEIPAAVRCLELPCVTGELRLQGESEGEGRVEVCVNNQWRGVRDELWTTQDAQVVCRQLGFSASGAVATSLPEGQGRVWLDGVMCSGREARLLDCLLTNEPGVSDSARSSNVGVRCDLGCTNGDIRLGRGSNSSSTEGFVEVCYDNVWGSVCADGWNRVAAQVACKELGFTPEGADTVIYPLDEANSTALLTDVQCLGNESRLTQCSGQLGASTVCPLTSAIARVTCRPLATTCTEGDVRLEGGATAMEGRVEVCHDNVWGTICDSNWSLQNAEVVCEQLGYFPEFSSLMLSGFENGVGQIWYQNIFCSKTDAGSRLIDCFTSNAPGDTANCSHARDAGVRCFKRRDDNVLPTTSTEDKVGSPSPTVTTTTIGDTSTPTTTTVDTSPATTATTTDAASTPALYFELRGTRYQNNSEAPLNNIGEGDNALLCVTDSSICCRTLRVGEFYYPNGTLVPIRSANQDYYRNRGTRLIRLNFRDGDRVGALSPEGKYLCEIPDSRGATQKLYITLAQSKSAHSLSLVERQKQAGADEKQVPYL